MEKKKKGERREERRHTFETLLNAIKKDGPRISHVRDVKDTLIMTTRTTTTTTCFDTNEENHLMNDACKCLMRLCVKDEECASEVFELNDTREYLMKSLREGAKEKDALKCRNVLYVMINALQCAREDVKTKHIVKKIVMDAHGRVGFKDLPKAVPAVRPALAKLVALSVRAKTVNLQGTCEARERCSTIVNDYRFVKDFFGALILWTREWTLEEEDEARMDVEMLLERVVDFETFPTMFRNLHENAEKNETKKDEMLREHLLSTSIDSTTANYAKVQNMVPTSFCDTQSTLLHFLARISVKSHRYANKTVHEKNPYVLPESVLAFLLDTTREAAKACKDEKKDYAFARNVLRECLFTLRSISEIESKPNVPDTVGFLTGIGIVRLLVGMIIALDPPSGSRQSKKATGPAKADEIPKFPIDDEAFGGQNFVRENFPTVKPYNGYRVDIMATLANAAHRRPRVCEGIRKLGGVAVVLSHTRGEEGESSIDGCEEEPFLREWALWGTRNLCETDDTIRKEIEVLAPEKILEAEELMKQGLKAELNPKTGKPRVVSIEKTSKVELETMTALGGSPAATRNEQNVVRIETKKTSPDNNKDEAEEEFQIPKNWKVAEL